MQLVTQVYLTTLTLWWCNFKRCCRKGSGTTNSDGASSGAGQSAWDFALTGDWDMLGLDGLAWGAGYGDS